MKSISQTLRDSQETLTDPQMKEETLSETVSLIHLRAIVLLRGVNKYEYIIWISCCNNTLQRHKSASLHHKHFRVSLNSSKPSPTVQFDLHQQQLQNFYLHSVLMGFR